MRTVLRSKIALLFMTCTVLMVVLPAMAFAQTSPTIQSDKDDYAPGSTVTLTGSGWQPGEAVHINVNDDQGKTWSRDVDVTADQNGGIQDQFQLPDWFVATYSVKATGASGAVATTSFTDASLFVHRGPTGNPPNVTFTVTYQTFSNNTCTSNAGTSQNAVINSDAGTNLGGLGGGQNTNFVKLTAPTTPTSPSGYTFDNWTSVAGSNNTITQTTSNSICVRNPASSQADAYRATYKVSDNTPPTTTASAKKATDPVSDYTLGDWSNKDVTVTLNASDNTGGTGVKETRYTLDGTDPTPSNGTVYSGAFTVNTEGTTTVKFRSWDNAGNAEAVQSKTVKIDKTAPGITPGDVNNTTWRNSPLSQTFTASDSGSGLASNQGLNADGTFTLTASAESTKDSNGNVVPTQVSKAVTDVAGNSTTRSLSAKIDKTAPVANCASAPTTWSKDDVSIRCQPTDALSGLANIADGDFNLSTSVPAGTETSTASTGSRSVADQAGNTVTAGPFTNLQVDKKAPTYDCGPADMAWRATDKTYNCSASDGGSGLSSAGATLTPASFILSTSVAANTEDSNASTNSKDLYDAVGNKATAGPISGNHIDKKVPSTNATTGTYNGGWTNQSVTVTLNANDGGSGVKSTEYKIDAGAYQPYNGAFTVGSDGDHTITYRSTDNVDNQEAAQTLNVKVDKTAPTITNLGPTPNQPNGTNGWYTTDVTNTFKASDSGSGLSDACKAAFQANQAGDNVQSKTTSGEGANVKVTSDSCTDVAGNTARGLDSATFKVDKTDPKADHSLSDQPNSNGWHKANVTVALSATDKDASGLNEGSGVKEIKYSINNGQAQAYDPTSKISLTNEGVYDIKYTATDNAGRTSAQGSLTVRLDKTAPTIQGSRTPAANANGWNNQNVTVSFTCADTGGSGVDTCSNDTILSNEGANQSVTGNATDKAGNTASATVGNINIDRTAIPSKASANRYSNSSPITVNYTTTGADTDLSGLQKVELWAKGPSNTDFVKVPGDKTTASGSFSYDVTQGDGDYRFYTIAEDKAGNREVVPTSADAIVTVTHDTAAPSLSVNHTADGSNGWNKTSPVTLAVMASDSGSGLAGDPTCKDGTTSLQLTAGNTSGTWTASVSGDGTHNVSCSVSDKATNQQTASDTVKIDTAVIPSKASANRYSNSSPITVNFSTTNASTDTSGLAKVELWAKGPQDPAYQKVATSTTDASGSFSYDVTQGDGDYRFYTIAEDKAGNREVVPTSADAIVTVTHDTAAPSLSVSHTGADANGWNTSSPVVLTVTASDSGSGLANDLSCKDGTTNLTLNPDAANTDASGTWTASVSGDGTHNVSCSVSDKATNQQTASDTVKIDTKAPTSTHTLSAPANANGWHNANVTVTLNASDGQGSGVQAIRYSINGGAPATYDAQNKPVISSEGTTTFSYRAVDNANNTEQPDHSFTIKLDKTNPVISRDGVKSGTPGTNGWYTSDVGYGFTAADPNGASASGLALADQAFTRNITTEGLNQNVSSGTVSDLAGNVATAINSPDFNIDKTKPTLNPIVSPNPVLLKAAATADPGASDALSGIASASCDPVDTSTVGTKSVNCSATDKAGNSDSRSASYGVNYNWNGYRQPVDNNGVFNTAKAGQAIPMKFSLFGNQGLNILQPSTTSAPNPKVTKVACTAGATVDSIEEYVATTNSGLTYDATADQYNYVWKTQSSYAGNCYKFDLVLIDGTHHEAYFKFTK